jgi:hypothetical protein
MPRRRLSSTDIVARALPQLQVPVSAIFYEYDGFNRLKAVRDKNNNILSENEYHYRNVY